MIYIEYDGDYYPIGEIKTWKIDNTLKGIIIGNKKLRMRNIKYSEHFLWVKRYINDMVKKGKHIIYLSDKTYDEYAL